MKRTLGWVAVLASAFFGGIASGQTAVVENLGNLDATTPFAEAFGVSGDGQVITGRSRSNVPAAARQHIYRWTSATGMVNLGSIDTTTANSWASGFGLSSDGSVMAGHCETGATFIDRGFRRDTSSGVLVAQPPLAGLTESLALDVSGDGVFVVGASVSGFGVSNSAGSTQSIAVNNLGATARATRWQSGTPANLGTISNVVGKSVATAISANGAVIVGQSFNGSQNHACVFPGPGNPVVDLGTIQNLTGSSCANDVSPDGTIVVGQSISISTKLHAMQWTSGGGMIDLGTADNFNGVSSAHGVSADGTTIVGESDNNFRPGGRAAIWFNGQPRQLMEYLVSIGANVNGWTSFDRINDCSDDGSVLVGDGIATNGSQSAFRIKLTINSPPTVSPLIATTVECNGTQNLVTLEATVNDANAGDSLQVVWTVNGTTAKTSNATPGSTVPFTFNYPDGPSTVQVSVSDGKAPPVSSTTTVTVSDTKDPIVVVASELNLRVDKGEIFATANLKKPRVNDICDPNPVVTSNAPKNKQFPIGETTVVWTVTDKSGNVAKAKQKVIVENRAPLADAGANVLRRTSKKRVTVQLSGIRSRDLDRQDLTFLWAASGAKIADPTAVSTSGRFKFGTTRVTLTVTDEAGAASTDVMIVRIKGARVARTSAKQADDAVRTSYANAAASGAAGTQASTAAYFLGALAGDDVNVNGDASRSDLLDYASLRIQQANLSSLAASQAYQSYLSGADENALVASLYASYAADAARRDIASGETSEVAVADVSKE